MKIGSFKISHTSSVQTRQTSSEGVEYFESNKFRKVTVNGEYVIVPSCHRKLTTDRMSRGPTQRNPISGKRRPAATASRYRFRESNAENNFSFGT